MGTLILISSSPPRPFARSPTPAASSSPGLASPSSIFGKGYRKFKNSTVHRDGFHGGYGNTRSILGTKIGSENLPFGITKSQHTSEKAAKELSIKLENVINPGAGGGKLQHNRSNGSATAVPIVEGEGKTESAALTAKEMHVENHIEGFFATTGDMRHDTQALSPLLLETVPANGSEGTPRKGSTVIVVDPELEVGPSRSAFPVGLLQSIGYEGPCAQASFSSRSNDEGAPTKRRRLDLVESGMHKPSEIAITPNVVGLQKSPATVTTKRSKSPKKKYTTITGLATSRYLFEEPTELEASPMLQYLAATQARDIGEAEEPPADTTKKKRAPRKPKVKKKSLPTSLLLSPGSAMKAIDSQDTVFGSASQLARNESPEIIRDIVHAAKQSESFNSCTPLPTQMTIPSEPGSAGISGTSRFKKSRNLWATASRDEDNALLQIDTLDLFDSSDLRLAFTGKDVMLEPTVPRQRELASPKKATPALRGAHSGKSGDIQSQGWLDIDEIGIPTPRAHTITKSLGQIRTMHTSSEPFSRKAKGSLQKDKLYGEGANKDPLANAHEPYVDASSSVAAGGSTGPPRVQMPVFSSFPTAELSSQIKKYGFKPFRKREKMIEVLENCWKAKNKPNDICTDRVASVDAPDEDFELATHGDILSNVHGLATRAAPKPAKMKARKPKEDKPDAPANPRRRKVAAKNEKSIERAVKKRKEAGPKAKESEDSLMEEATRTLKAKAPTLSAEYVVDISDLENSSLTAPDKRPKQSAVITTTEGSGHAVQSATHLAASSTIPQLKSLELEPVTPRPPDRLNLDLPDINSQITKAITNYVPLPSRDHQRDPTWHEKILMYEPIVLEDLATWLNTEGLRLVGEDREVSALEVRAWCEMKGVCCYGVGGGWRGSAKGKTGADIGEAGG